jgi:hypothetical protein
MKTKNGAISKICSILEDLKDDIIADTFDEMSSVIANALKEDGCIIIKDLEIKENIEDFSNKVEWEGYITIEKDGFEFVIYISGTAQAVISYGSWSTTDMYEIDGFDIY